MGSRVQTAVNRTDGLPETIAVWQFYIIVLGIGISGLRGTGHDNIAPNCHAGRKPEWDLCAELCFSAQGHCSDKAR